MVPMEPFLRTFARGLRDVDDQKSERIRKLDLAIEAVTPKLQHEHWLGALVMMVITSSLSRACVASPCWHFAAFVRRSYEDFGMTRALGDIQHYVAKTSDPTCFKELSPAIRGFGTVRPYIFHDKANNTVTLFYEQYKPLFFNTSFIFARQAEVGKWNFGSPKTILEPTLNWEKEGQSRIGNAFVYYNKVKGKYWLYYSCSSIRLDDSDIDEPKYFGLAEADNILGPYTRVLQKPMEIRGDIPGETVKGYGSLKIIKNPAADIGENGVGVALCNRLTLEEPTGRSGSTISLIKTSDGGLSWDTVIPKFIGPSLIEDDWKMAYVYAFDTLINPLDNKTELIYYNARNGYKDAYEEAGVSRFPVEMIEQARNS